MVFEEWIDAQGWVLSLELMTGCGGLLADFCLKSREIDLSDDVLRYRHTAGGQCVELAPEPRCRLAGSLIAFC